MGTSFEERELLLKYFSSNSNQDLQIRPQANIINPKKHSRGTWTFKSIVRYRWTAVDMEVKPGNKKSRIEA